MEIRVRKFDSFEEEQAADRAFWLQRTPSERVEIVEDLRRQWWSEHGEGEPGLRRVVRVLPAA